MSVARDSAFENVYNRHELAAALGIPVRTLSCWINLGRVPKAKGTNPRWSYYDDTHLAAAREYIAKRKSAMERPFKP